MNRIKSFKTNINGLETHYLTCGKGEPLIIVHGGGDGANAWMRNIAVLSRKYKIYVPDMPGFGMSQPLINGYSMYHMVEFINSFAQAMGLSKFYLMGHSLGGGIALHYTLKFPEKIRKLVLVSSLCLGSEIAWWVRMASSPVICKSLGRAAISLFQGIKYIAKFFGPWNIVQPVSKTSIQIGSCISTLTEQTVVLLSQLPKIMVPTLVMWGAKDPIVPFAQAYAAAELIPNCQVKVFENAGHSVYREKLREFSNILAEFLDRVSPSAAAY
jgi:pimeloyl-ACP methyl ester carboxylesterase